MWTPIDISSEYKVLTKAKTEFCNFQPQSSFKDSAEFKNLKKRWLELIKVIHPDKYEAKYKQDHHGEELPPTLKQAITELAQAVNACNDKLEAKYR